MGCNVGRWDRVARILIGSCVVALAFLGPKTVWGLAGLVLVVTAMSGWCPLYELLHVGTRRPGEPKAPA
jgi:hypothetical protein